MLKKITIAVALAFSSHAYAVDNTFFDDFTPLATSQVGALPDATPIKLSDSYFTKLSVADRTTDNVQAPCSNTGSWDMIDAEATGRYLSTPFKTGNTEYFSGLLLRRKSEGLSVCVILSGFVI